MLDVACMHIALLHLLATQTTSPLGTLTIGEGVALALLTAVVGIAAAWGLMRGQVSGLVRRVEQLELAAPSTNLGLARVEVRLDAMEKSIGERLDALRRELHASVNPRHRDGE